jgi:hypothetical protein
MSQDQAYTTEDWLDGILSRCGEMNPDAVQIADASVAIWYDIAAAMQSVFGKQGFVALYNRGAALAAQKNPWLGASRADDGYAAFDKLRSIIAEQSDANAALGSSQLLQSFDDLLAGLVGGTLCEQLLAPVRANALHPSDKRRCMKP